MVSGSVSSEKPRFRQTEIGLVPEDWEVKKLNELGAPKEVVLTGPFGSLLHSSDYAEKGVPLLLVNCIEDGRLSGEKIPKVNRRKAEELKRFLLKEGDIVFSRVGVVGRTLYIDSDKEGWMFSGQTLRIRLNNPRVYNRFVEYYFRSPSAKNISEKTSLGTTRPSINTSILANRIIPLPTLLEQRAITRILLDLDLKINLNRTISRALETVARAIFKRWFIDFEFPNEEGKPYKSNGDSFIESDMGEIPEGWATGGLGSICDITMGQSPPGETYNETGNGIPFFQGIRDFGFRFPSKRVYCTAPTRFARENDVLLSVRAPIGSLNVAEERCAIGRGVAALRLKGKQNGFLYYLLLTTHSAWNEYEAKGTVFGSATKQDIHDFKVIIPPKDLLDRFGNMVEPLDKRILLNRKEVRTLSTIRDSLLPRLMAGQVRVPVPKEITEES